MAYHHNSFEQAISFFISRFANLKKEKKELPGITNGQDFYIHSFNRKLLSTKLKVISY